MKVVKSKCENVWLFDVKHDEDLLTAGFACFLPNCNSEVELAIKGEMRFMMVPFKAVGSLLPLRMINARLSLLSPSQDEQVF